MLNENNHYVITPENKEWFAHYCQLIDIMKVYRLLTLSLTLVSKVKTILLFIFLIKKSLGKCYKLQTKSTS